MPTTFKSQTCDKFNAFFVGHGWTKHPKKACVTREFKNGEAEAELWDDGDLLINDHLMLRFTNFEQALESVNTLAETTVYGGWK